MPVTRPAFNTPDYELLRPIGRGAYGEVWLARNVTGSWVALKIVHRSAFDHDRPFEREFEGIKRFEPISRSDPSQVAILHVGLGDGFFYYVMELADAAEPQREDGELKMADGKHSDRGARHPPSSIVHPQDYAPRTLRSELHTCGHLPADECLAIALSLTRALAHLHGHGLVHRDVKPSNVIFVNGQAKLADIGLVTSVDATRSFVGTEGYLPPEGAGTPRADLYSLGKVLYEMSTGCDRKEFPKLPADIATRPDRDALAELNAIVVRACQLDARQRYANAEAMRTDLELLLQGNSVRRKRTVEQGVALVKKTGLVIGLMVLVATLSWIVGASSKSRRIVPTATSTSLSPMPAETKSIAVLPFDNDSPDKADKYLGAAIADEIGHALSKVPDLRVVGRSSALVLKQAKDRRAATESVKLHAVVEGSIRKTGSQLHITVQLVNTTDSFVLWVETYDRDVAEIYGVQTDVTEKIAEILGLKLTETVRTRLALKPTKNLQAYQLYLEGRYQWTGGLGTSRERAMERFQSAIQLDPNFAAAYAGLADCYVDATREIASGREFFPKALENANRAVELSPGLAEAHTALARVKCHYEYDWTGADKEFQLAIRLSPADAMARRWYSQYLDITGRFEEAITQAKLATGLDPFSEAFRVSLAWNLFDARLHEQALEEFMRVHQLNEQNGEALDGIAWCRFVRGEHDDAIMLWERANQLTSLNPEKNAELAQAYKQAGMREYWLKRIEQAKERVNPSDMSPYWIAGCYAALGDKNQAFAWLERAYEDRTFYMAWVAVEYQFSGLHSDPRFAALLNKMGLKMPVWKK